MFPIYRDNIKVFEPTNYRVKVSLKKHGNKVPTYSAVSHK
jgi:hypothetical protein